MNLNNLCTFKGILAKDPVKFSGPTTFEVEVRRPKRDKDPDTQHVIDLIPCEVWGESGERALKLTAGAIVRVMGEFRIDEKRLTDPDGNEVVRKFYKIYVERLELITSLSNIEEPA